MQKNNALINNFLLLKHFILYLIYDVIFKSNLNINVKFEI